MSEYKAPALMPMSMADIIDASVRLYRRNFGVFLGIIAIVYVPLGVIQVITAFLVGGMQELGQADPTEMPWDQLAMVFVAYGGLILFSIFAVPIAQGALSVAVSRRYLNYPASVADAYGTIGVRWAPLLGTVFLTGIVSVVGLMFCLVPGIYLGGMWIFVTPIIAIEGLGGFAAMRRSWDLVSGEWWRVFGTYFLLSLLVGLISSVVTMPVSVPIMLLLGQNNMALAQAISTGFSTTISVLVQPVAITGLVLLYYDLRVRKEGFDVGLLAESLNLPADQVLSYEQVNAWQPAPAAAAVSMLADYAREAQAMGLTYEQAREQLVAEGWTEAQVEEHLPAAWSGAEG